METPGPPHEAPTSRGLVPGERMFARFVLQRVLGQGGMGVVWLAQDEVLECPVALKFLAERLRWDEAALRGLKEETRRARALTHPGIVRIHDLFEGGGQTAIAMEFVAGGSLHQVRAHRQPPVMLVREIQHWLPGMAAALDYAHANGVIHRDLKPSNLLCAASGEVKIADFGIAQPLAETALRLSQWAPSGTLAYMSPQQHFGEPPAPADDIYALGTTLYELLSGKPPFHSGNLAVQIERRVPESLAARRKQAGYAGEVIPLQVEETVAACLAKRAEDRPANAAEVVARLNGAAPTGARRRPGLVTYYVTNPLRRARRRTRWLALGALVLAAALALQRTLFSTRPVVGKANLTQPAAHPSDATRAYAAWNFDGDGREGSGRDWALQSDRVVPTEDRFGQIDRALYLNGGTAILREGLPVEGWGADRPFSVALWVRPASAEGGMLATLRSDRQDDFHWDISFTAYGPRFAVGRSHLDGSDEVGGPQPLPVGQWSHVAATSDGRMLRLFVDGWQVAQAPLANNRGALLRHAPALLVGYTHKFDTVRLAGALDELRLWQRALTPVEIARLAAPEPPPRLRLTTGVYAGTDDLPAAVTREFGPTATLGDWQDLRRWHEDDIVAFCDALPLALNASGPLLQNGGKRHSEAKRHYFLNRFEGRKPDYYLAHEELGGMRLALGSWTAAGMVALARLPFAPPQTEALRSDASGEISREIAAQPALDARALHWQQEFRPQASAAARCELALRDGRRVAAVFAPTADGTFALALGDATRPGLARQVAATYGPLDFAVVVRGGKMFFRAVNPVGAAVVFQEQVAAGFTLREVARVTLSGVAAAELTLER